MKRTGLILVCALYQSLMAQPSDRIYTRQEYISMYQDDAVKEMHRAGIPASITIAQALLESGDGNSPLARYANNHFGIKCHDWTGAKFIQDDDTRNECFRKYSDPYDSYQDHSEFLKNRPRYGFLFSLKPTDYKGWAKGLKKAGYATNPKYPEMLIKIIEENGLHELDIHERIPENKLHQPKLEKPAKPIARQIEMGHDYSVQMHENHIPYVIAKAGDTPERIAKEFDMAPWEIAKYNDLGKNASLHEGDIVFMKPKRKSNKKQGLHVAEKGEDLWMISQKYGIKLKKLMSINGLEKGDTLKAGDKIKLK
jgi:LysM repeat protein